MAEERTIGPRGIGLNGHWAHPQLKIRARTYRANWDRASARHHNAAITAAL
jgi:hypothetical protein